MSVMCWLTVGDSWLTVSLGTGSSQLLPSLSHINHNKSTRVNLSGNGSKNTVYR